MSQQHKRVLTAENASNTIGVPRWPSTHVKQTSSHVSQTLSVSDCRSPSLPPSSSSSVLFVILLHAGLWMLVRLLSAGAVAAVWLPEGLWVLPRTSGAVENTASVGGAHFLHTALLEVWYIVLIVNMPGPFSFSEQTSISWCSDTIIFVPGTIPIPELPGASANNYYQSNACVKAMHPTAAQRAGLHWHPTIIYSLSSFIHKAGGKDFDRGAWI